MKREIIVIAHDIRSAHNIGSLLRTCEGLGVHKIIFSGYSPYPAEETDTRLPHIVRKLSAQIEKTSLGAEKTIPWEHQADIYKVFDDLKAAGFVLVALEQDKNSTKLPEYSPPQKVALLLGSEVTGIEKELLKYVDAIVEIPMFGQKESFNVVQAAAMALYQLTFY